VEVPQSADILSVLSNHADKQASHQHGLLLYNLCGSLTRLCRQAGTASGTAAMVTYILILSSYRIMLTARDGTVKTPQRQLPCPQLLSIVRCDPGLNHPGYAGAGCAAPAPRHGGTVRAAVKYRR
jgi:hypothetical protein